MIPRLFFVWAVAMFTSTVFAQAQTYGEILGNEGVQKIVREETDHFVEQFNAMTGFEAIWVEEGFYPAVTKPILSIRAPDRETAYRSLQVGFGSFMSDLAAFLSATQSKVVFGAEQVSTYLEVSRKVRRCGRIPCTTGCPQACDDVCNPCRR